MLQDDANAALKALAAQVGRNRAYLSTPHPTDAFVAGMINQINSNATQIKGDLDAVGADPAPDDQTPPPTPTPTPTPAP